MIIAIVKNKMVIPFGTFKILLGLGIVILLLITLDKKWLDPKYQEVIGKKSAILMKKNNQSQIIKPDQFLHILYSFAQVQNDHLWIHKLKIKEEKFYLTIRSHTYDDIEKYMNSVISVSEANVTSMKIKNVNKEEVKEEEQEEEQPPVPFAVALFLQQEALEREEENDDESDNAKNDVLYNFEAKVVLSPKSV